MYVDDIVLTGDSIMEIIQVKSFLYQQFRIKDLGQLRYFLGLEVACSTSLYLSQLEKIYAQDD